jgi:hypothetical protein
MYVHKGLPPYEADEAKRTYDHARCEPSLERVISKIRELLSHASIEAGMTLTSEADRAKHRAVAFALMDVAVSSGLMCPAEHADRVSFIEGRLTMLALQDRWYVEQPDPPPDPVYVAATEAAKRRAKEDAEFAMRVADEVMNDMEAAAPKGVVAGKIPDDIAADLESHELHSPGWLDAIGRLIAHSKANAQKVTPRSADY